MLKITKEFIWIFAITLLLFSNSACTQEKVDTAPKLAASGSGAGNSAVSESSVESVQVEEPKVFQILSVSAPIKGKAVDFTWLENGKERTFSELTKNKAVFINFWGTWCPPCRKEIPDIIEMAKELSGKDIIIIGIALERDAQNALSNVKSFAKAKGINYINFTDNKQELAIAYGGIQAVPTTYIIGKDGQISETIIGMRSKQEFLTSINPVIK